MKIASASLNQTPLDWENNKDNILNALSQAKENNIDLICLPEMCIPGYGCEDMFLHPWLAEKSLEILQEILPYTTGIATILGLPYHFKKAIYNVVCLIEDGTILGFQAKQNLPHDGIHYEPRWFSPWEAERLASITLNNKTYDFGDRIYIIKGKKIGFEICEDAWVEDRPACKLAERNIDIILNPSASHFALLKSQERELKVIKASKEFNCTYVFANLLGNEAGRVIYDGDAIISHKGKLAANTPLFSFYPVVLTFSEIDYEADRISSFNINPPLDVKEEQFIAATTLALYDYLRKSKSKGFVLSLSGGADSSLCLVLLSEMIKRSVSVLGTSKFLANIGYEEPAKHLDLDEINRLIITAAFQATSNSSTETFDSARHLANSVGATFYSWSIDKEVEDARLIMEGAIGRKLSWDTDDVVLQNIQARSRSPLIWMLANLENKLLVTTSNRSEGSVGYATMDGDTSGSIAPIAGIDKRFVLNWLKWAEHNLGYTGLSKVNKLAPTAELRPPENNQTDEQDLMPYEILEKIERLFVLEKQSPLAIHSELSKSISEQKAAEFIIKFFTLWSRNQWKRERTAPSLHLDDYNIDPRSGFRFPILSGSFKIQLDVLKKLLR